MGSKETQKKVLVLGGTGAIGTYFVRELLRLGYDVVVTSRSDRVSNERRLHFLKGDAKDDRFLEDILSNDGYDAIVDFMIYKTAEFRERIDLLLRKTSHYMFLSSYRVYADSADKLINEKSRRLLDTTNDKAYLATDEYALAKARQEDILIKQKKYKNWTILRPAITYSSDRFQLGTMEAHEFIPRGIKGKPVIFPNEMLNKVTTMTWAGDVAKMIAKLVLNKNSYGEIYNVSTAEHHRWSDVLNIYKINLKLKVKIVPLAVYTKIFGRPYQIKNDRMLNRKIDNHKILNETGIKQKDLMTLNDGLRIELTNFMSSPKRKLGLDKKLDKQIDDLTTSRTQKIRTRISPRLRVRQIKRLAKSRLKFDGAIVTLTVYNNYGNVIQRYALQHFLAKNNLRFNMLDFHSGAINKNHKQIKKFVDKHLIQEKFEPRLSKFYKTYVVGSDQVWRHFSINKGWGKFGSQFLSFVTSRNANRIAYAASFGVDTFERADIDESRKKRIMPLLKKFDSVSVREKSGLELVNQLGFNGAVQTIDPTLLLRAADYSSLIKNSKYNEQRSADIFYYLIEQTSLTQAAIDYYKGDENKSFGILPYAKGAPLPAIEKWLKSIRDADIVVTDSYHAMVFSIIFHTDFVVFDKKGGGIARIAELLEPLGLSDRIVIQGNKKKYVPKYKPIDWKKVDKVLDAKRKESSQWLLDVLKKEK